METSQYLSEVLKELQLVPQLISDTESEQLIHSIAVANKVFVAGAGRSGFMIRSLAMRLMHMGIQAYVVGETVTPVWARVTCSLSVQALVKPKA